MSEAPERDAVMAIWLEQPEEEHPVEIERFANSWAERLRDKTRSEILMSIAAAALFLLLMGWRFILDRGSLPKVGWATAASVVVWSLVSLYWFRRRIWTSGNRQDVAAAGLEYYRTELEQRSAHLRNAWLWHGPLLLACAVPVALLSKGGIAEQERLRSALPLLVVLAVWIAFGIRRRRREAAELESEIRAIDKFEARPPEDSQL